MSNKEVFIKPLFIKKIHLKNYRTYKDLTIEFKENIHTVVGPNECGKTNMLMAFEMFNDVSVLDETNKCSYIENYVNSIPEIEFTLNPKIVENYVEDSRIENLIVKFLGDKRKIEVSAKDNLEVIKKVEKFINKLDIINWEFDEEKYHIPNCIQISELKNNFEKYQSILNFFKVANVKIEDFLNKSDHTKRENILRIVNESVSKVLSQSWTQYQNMKLNMYLNPDNVLNIGFLENNRNIDPTTRSLGFQWFFAFLLHFNANFDINDERNCIILLDEPGIHLHPGGQRDLLEEIEKLGYHHQVIYTTHLPFMINKNHPDRLIILDKKGGITQLREPRKEGIFDDILIADTLGFSFSSLSNFSEINLFVEGITDKILLEKLSRVYAERENKTLLNLNYLSIIPINGLSNLDSFIRVANTCQINFLVLIDADNFGKNKYKKYRDHPEKYNNAHKNIFILDNEMEIEDTVPREIINTGLEIVKNDIYPWNEVIMDDFVFNEGKTSSQIDDLMENIQEQYSSHNLEKGEIDVMDLETPQLKLELMLSIIDVIDDNNYHEFEYLINLLKKINEKAAEMVKNLRS